jgi:hypothetical protein
MADFSLTSRKSFDVGPDGTLYALLSSSRRSGSKLESASFIVKYEDGGSVDSTFRVGEAEGKRINPLRLAVFGDGNFLLSGTVPPPGDVSKGGQLGTFAGIFNRSGAFEAPLKLMETATLPDSSGLGDHRKSVGTTMEPSSTSNLAKLDANAVTLESGTLSFSSPDGNLYILQGSSAPRLYAVSPAGYVMREHELKPPEPGLSPVQMAAAGPGYLFIDFANASGAFVGNQDEADRLVVLNSESGKVVAVYSLAKADAGFSVPACAVSPYEFLFLGSDKNNRLEVVRYVAR